MQVMMSGNFFFGHGFSFTILVLATMQKKTATTQCICLVKK